MVSMRKTLETIASFHSTKYNNKMKQSYLENIYPNLKIQDNTFSNIRSFDEELKELLGKW